MKLKSPKGLLQYARIKALYRRAFPRCERKPFSLIMEWKRKGRSDIWYFEENGEFLGFATTINGEREVLIDYFAINDKKRSQGNGTRILKAILAHYAPTGVFLEIEIPDERADNYSQRVRRKKFYLSAGLQPMGTRAKLFGTDMELLGVGCHLDYDEYRNFYLQNYSRSAYDNIEKID